ncbi:MAG: CBS domain-containing protein [Halobacteriaceae archaeon]
MHLPTPQDLRERRNELDLTQSELANRADVSQPLIARIEGGDVDPRLSTLRRIVEALDEAEGDVVRAADVMNTTVVSVRPDDSVRGARDLMLEEGYSQLPVIRDGQPQGIISNSDIRQAREETTGETEVGDLPVADVMHGSYNTVEPDAPLEQIDNYLDHSRAVIVVEDGHVVGIITEADVAARLS